MIGDGDRRAERAGKAVELRHNVRTVGGRAGRVLVHDQGLAAG